MIDWMQTPATTTATATWDTTTALVWANSFLLIVAGYFIREFVGNVRELTKEINTFKLDAHGRLTKLEAEIEAALRAQSDQGSHS